MEVNMLMGLNTDQLLDIAIKVRPVSPVISPPLENQVSPPSTKSENLQSLEDSNVQMDLTTLFNDSILHYDNSEQPYLII